MGRCRGEAKRIKPGSKPSKVTLYTEDEAEANATNGELPIFNTPRLVRSHLVDERTRQIGSSSRQFGTSSRSLQKGKSDAGKGRSDVSADVHLGGHVETGWPLGNQEIASSFRFELDSGRLQSILHTPGGSFRRTPHESFRRPPHESFRRTPHESFRRTPHESFRSTPGGSFRFRNDALGNVSHGSPLPKPPRQVEKPIPNSSSRCAEANEFEFNKSANLQGEDGVAAPSSNWSIVPFEPRNSVAVDVPNSPERSVVLQRLKELKSQSASPRFGLEDDVSYHKELAKLTVGRDDGLNQWLKTSSPLRKSNNSSQKETSHPHQEIPTAHPIYERPRGSVTPPSSRFKNNRTGSSSSSSIQEQIHSISKQSVTRNVNSPSPDHTHFLPTAIPFQWEDQPGRPKGVRLSRQLSREAVETIQYMENLPSSEMAGTSGIVNGDEGRTESHRYYGKAQLQGHSRETSLGHSSRRNSTADKFFDLDASAAAKFLVEQYDTPMSTPGRRGSSPAYAVPFKWEDAPGKAKVETPARRPDMLQLPPRLAVPSFRSAESFGRASYPFAGFFAPCMTASSSLGDRKNSFGSSKSLPRRVPSGRKRHGLVGRCSSLPQEGCQIIVSRSAASSPVLKPTGTDSFENRTSPTSILLGPDGSSSQTSTSHLVFSSGDLDEYTQKTSKSSSYASIEEDFSETPTSFSLPPTLKPDPHTLISTANSSTQSARGSRRSDLATLLRASADDSEIQPVQASPKRPTRLPYTMPSVAEQVMASGGESARRQLIQDLSPRLLRQYSGPRLTRSSNTPASRVERSAAEKTHSLSPAYAAALELLSPAVKVVAKRRSPARMPLTKARRRRPRFMLSICRTLKRVVLGRRKHSKPIDSTLMMYCDALEPRTFQFSKPN